MASLLFLFANLYPSVSAYNAQYGANQVTVHYLHHPLHGCEVEVVRADPDGFLVKYEGVSRWIPKWMTSVDCARFRAVSDPVLPVAALQRLHQLVAGGGLDDGSRTASVAAAPGEGQ